MGELRDARALGSTLVAAVGPATADALRTAGVEPDLVPAEHRAAGLVAAFPDHEPGSSGNLVLFPCAEEAPSTISEGLEREGVGGPARQCLPDRRPAPARRLAVGADGSGGRRDVHRVLLGHGLRRSEGARWRARCAVPPLVICIGPTTATDARALGMTGVEEADGPSSEGIVAALVRNLAPGS